MLNWYKNCQANLYTYKIDKFYNCAIDSNFLNNWSVKIIQVWSIVNIYKILINIVIVVFLINKKITLIALRNNRIKILNIIRFYRICKICNILNKVFEAWFYLVLKFE